MEFFKKYFFNLIRYHYADFKGRATRKQYWLWCLCDLVIQFLIGFIIGFYGGITDTDVNAKVRFANGLFNLATFIPWFAIAVRRLHDAGKSGWNILLQMCLYIFAFFVFVATITDSVFGVIGLFVVNIYVIYVFCLPSQKGANKYGKDPHETALTAQIEQKN